MQTEMSGEALENRDLSPILVIAFAENIFSSCFFGSDFRMYSNYFCIVSVIVNVHLLEMVLTFGNH